MLRTRLMGLRAVALHLTCCGLTAVGSASAQKQTPPAPGTATTSSTASDHLKRGLELYGKHDLDGAIAEFREALRLKPDFAEAHNNLGTALRMKGDLDGAIVEFREALRLKPDFPKAHFGLGFASEQKGDRQQALQEYRKACQFAPSKADFCAQAQRLSRELGSPPR